MLSSLYFHSDLTEYMYQIVSDFKNMHLCCFYYGKGTLIIHLLFLTAFL